MIPHDSDNRLQISSHVAASSQFELACDLVLGGAERGVGPKDLAEAERELEDAAAPLSHWRTVTQATAAKATCKESP